jgi:hypothetical protein
LARRFAACPRPTSLRSNPGAIFPITQLERLLLGPSSPLVGRVPPGPRPSPPKPNP